MTAPICETCKGAGVVWARALALPVGLRRFVGGRWNKHEDGQHVEVPCPSCGYATPTQPTNPEPEEPRT